MTGPADNWPGPGRVALHPELCASCRCSCRISSWRSVPAGAWRSAGRCPGRRLADTRWIIRRSDRIRHSRFCHAHRSPCVYRPKAAGCCGYGFRYCCGPRPGCRKRRHLQRGMLCRRGVMRDGGGVWSGGAVCMLPIGVLGRRRALHRKRFIPLRVHPNSPHCPVPNIRCYRSRPVGRLEGPCISYYESSCILGLSTYCVIIFINMFMLSAVASVRA